MREAAGDGTHPFFRRGELFGLFLIFFFAHGVLAAELSGLDVLTRMAMGTIQGIAERCRWGADQSEHVGNALDKVTTPERRAHVRLH